MIFRRRVSNSLLPPFLDFANPALVYGAVWLVAIILVYVPTHISVAPEPIVQSSILLTILSFFFWYWLCRSCLGAAATTTSFPLACSEHQGCFHRLNFFVRILFWVWLVGFFLNMTLSEGLPLIWQLTDDKRSYGDFGVPSFSGILVGIKLFLVSGLIQLIPTWGKRRVYIYLGILFLTTFFELSRGGLVLLALAAVGTVCTLTGMQIRRLKWIVLGTLIFIMVFGALASLRDVRGDPNRMIAGLVPKNSIFLKLPGGFFWTFAYWFSPLNNLYYGYPRIEPTYYPNQTIQLLVPTVFRGEWLTENTFPVPLVTKALNATSFWSPFYADFGLEISVCLFIGMQLLLILVYLKSRSRCPTFVLLNSFNVAVLGLSVFYNFFISLPVIFAFILVTIYAAGLRHSS